MLRYKLLYIPLLLFMFSCTSGRWVVTDMSAIDDIEASTLKNERDVLLISQSPTQSDPVLTLNQYVVRDVEYNQRVLVERTVQSYKPRWGFTLLTAAGSIFSFLAANGSTIVPQAGSSQSLALNFTGGVLAVLALTHLQTTGEPIYTGEQRLQRKSGTEIKTDTVKVTSTNTNLQNEIPVKVYLEDDLIFDEEISVSNGSARLNLGTFESQLRTSNSASDIIKVTYSYNKTVIEQEYFVGELFVPHVIIQEPIAVLRALPSRTNRNIVAELGQGSTIKLLDTEDREWFRVEYGGTEAFLLREFATIGWFSVADENPERLVEMVDIPFGEIDVENSIPVLKSSNPADKVLIISNADNNLWINRDYLERDKRLFRHYMRTAFQVDKNNMAEVSEQKDIPVMKQLESLDTVDESGTLYVYLTGFLRVDGNQIVLYSENEAGEVVQSHLEDLFSQLARMKPNQLFLFADVDIEDNRSAVDISGIRNGQESILQRVSNQLLLNLPNSSIIFSSQPGQESMLYAGQVPDDKRHQIFTYFLADAIKQRKTVISDIVRHLSDNVNFTSRRLHDQPQEIQAFGNFTLNMANE